MSVIIPSNTAQTYWNPPPADVFIRIAEPLRQGRGGITFNNGPREYTLVYHVWTRYLVDTSWVGQAPGLPADWTPYVWTFETAPGAGYTQIDEAAILVEKRVDLLDEDDAFHWKVTCRWSTNVPDTGRSYTDDPSRNPVRIDWDSQTERIARSVDLRGKQLLCANMQPYIPVPTFPDARAVGVITHVVRSHTALDSLRWSYVTNKEAFLGLSADCWLMEPPVTESFYVGTNRFHRVRRRIVSGRMLDDGSVEPWTPTKILNQGVMRRQNDSTKPNYNQAIPIYRGTSPISQPVLLDEDGQPIAPINKAFAVIAGGGGLGAAETTIEPTYGEYQMYRRMLYADLFLNQPLPPN